MGYSYLKHSGGTITNFDPDDTEKKFYLDGWSTNLEALLEKAQEKWPGIRMDEINLGAEYIHTNCLYYDQYDPGDYTNFITVTADEDYFTRMGLPVPKDAE